MSKYRFSENSTFYNHSLIIGYCDNVYTFKYYCTREAQWIFKQLYCGVFFSIECFVNNESRNR